MEAKRKSVEEQRPKFPSLTCPRPLALPPTRSNNRTAATARSVPRSPYCSNFYSANSLTRRRAWLREHEDKYGIFKINNQRNLTGQERGFCKLLDPIPVQRRGRKYLKHCITATQVEDDKDDDGGDRASGCLPGDLCGKIDDGKVAGRLQKFISIMIKKMKKKNSWGNSTLPAPSPRSQARLSLDAGSTDKRPAAKRSKSMSLETKSGEQVIQRLVSETEGSGTFPPRRKSSQRRLNLPFSWTNPDPKPSLYSKPNTGIKGWAEQHDTPQACPCSSTVSNSPRTLSSTKRSSAGRNQPSSSFSSLQSTPTTTRQRVASAASKAPVNDPSCAPPAHLWPLPSFDPFTHSIPLPSFSSPQLSSLPSRPLVANRINRDNVHTVATLPGPSADTSDSSAMPSVDTMLSQHYYLLHHNPTPSTEDLKRQCEARLEAVDAQARLEVVKERARKKIQMNALQARKAKVRKAQKVWEGRNAMNEGRERGGGRRTAFERNTSSGVDHGN